MESDAPWKDHERKWREEERRLARLHGRLGTGRLIGVGIALLVLWSVETYAPAYRWPFAGLLAAAFAATAVAFFRLERARKYAQRALVLYQPESRPEARRKHGAPSCEDVNVEAEHSYAFDADIVGSGGLLEHVSIATTTTGLARLTAMLISSRTKDVIDRRQAAVRELAPEVSLRERFYVLGSIARTHVRTARIRAWSRPEAVTIPFWIPAVCAVASCLFLSMAAVAWARPSLATYLALLPAFGALLLARNLASRRLEKVALPDDLLHPHFKALCQLARVLEQHEFRAQGLRDIAAELHGEQGQEASRTLTSGARLMAFVEASHNQIVAIFGPLVLYKVQLALAAERWRGRHREAVVRWIGALGKFEAFSSLACFCFEHPDYRFPEVVQHGPLLHGRDLAHPLLGAEAVANDVSLDSRRPVLLVSGANMAGKSTLLRTLCTNIALTHAGAPVRASSLVISPMYTVASIRVQDSLKDGLSRFAAELRRVEMFLDGIRGGMPTLVLIDELFAGTNSFDRFTGAVALTAFVLQHKSSLAVLSTHDRNVTRWADEKKDRITNVHFRDVFKAGKMHFDYKLQAGPALHGNALELMKQAGLPIPEDAPTAAD